MSISSDLDPVPSPSPVRLTQAEAAPLPENSVWVGTGSYLSNPFRSYVHCAGPDGDWGVVDTGRFGRTLGNGWVSQDGADRVAVDLFIREFGDVFPLGSTGRYCVLMSLRGKDLVCECALDARCHADLLLAWANPADSADVLNN